MSDVRCPVCGRPHLHLTAGPVICTSCLLRAGAQERVAPPVATGESLLEHVRTLNVIGEGPRGLVFLAEWTTPGGGMVALKCAPLSRATAPVEPRLAALDHPSIATIHELGTHEAVGAYAITDYVPGMPIIRFCDRQQLSSIQRLELWLQAADAIAYAHARDLPHLNLKPTNLLVASGVVQVVDFERALPVVEIARGPYCAPEQRSAGEPDVRSDVFALGVLLGELLGARSAVPLLDDLIQKAAHPEVSKRPRTVAALTTRARACLQELEVRQER